MKFLYTIMDSKAEGSLNAFGPLFPADNDNLAQRLLINTLTAPGAERTNLRAFPDDFTLVVLGSYDQITGEIKTLPRRVVCSVKSVVLTLSSVPADVQPTQPQ